jgi:hypothetical protein
MLFIAQKTRSACRILYGGFRHSFVGVFVRFVDVADIDHTASTVTYLHNLVVIIDKQITTWRANYRVSQSIYQDILT